VYAGVSGGLDPPDQGPDKITDDGQDKNACSDQRGQRHIDLEEPDAHGANDGPSDCCTEHLQNEFTHLLLRIHLSPSRGLAELQFLE